MKKHWKTLVFTAITSAVLLCGMSAFAAPQNVTAKIFSAPVFVEGHESYCWNPQGQQTDYLIYNGRQDQAPKDIIIAINDNAQDGTDISWLWDVDFDLLGNDSVKSITVSGIRCQDMRLRLKYVDIPSVLEGDVEKAIRDRVEDGVGNLYVLVNYTALFSTRNILKRLEGEK